MAQQFTQQIQLTLEDGRVLSVERGTTLEDIALLARKNTESPAMLGVYGGKMRELTYRPMCDGEVSFLDLESVDGYRTYVRTLYIMLIHTIRKVLGPEACIRIKHSVTGGTYCAVTQGGREGVTEEELDKIRTFMKELVRRDEPISRDRYPLEDAMEYFADHNMKDKTRVFRYRRFSVINMYSLESSRNYFYGYMLPRTGLADRFELTDYQGGLVLQLPSPKWPHEVQAFTPSHKLFDVYSRSAKWSKILGVEDIGALNDCIASGRFGELVQVSEALHAAHIASIAREIASRAGETRIVLIAGPSSSGKTTFAKKLCVQLKAEGKKPHLISVDDYFIDREKTPLGEDGKPDFENLNAIDIAKFNEDLNRLLKGESVVLPRFNFVTGHREYHKHPLTMNEEDILVIEGIHCLNEQLTSEIPRSEKFKIYISALTLINIDDHNRIPTTDGRLLRRMVRDHRSRGASAAQTIAMWPSVRKGEERNIFPYQEEADVMFNSAHIYELAILKQFAEPLLFGIDRTQPEYQEARRLIKFLDYCLGVSSEVVPSTSIIREFIGGSVFED